MSSKLTAYLDRDIEQEAPTSISRGGYHDNDINLIFKNRVQKPPIKRKHSVIID